MRGGLLATGVLAVAVPAAGARAAAAQGLEAGRKTFEQRCVLCHGADGEGGERGPAIAERLPASSDPDLVKLIHEGRPPKGMPGRLVPEADIAALVTFLRTLQRETPALERRTIPMTDGRSLEGEIVGEGLSDLQVRTSDTRVHLLRRDGERFREVTSESDWPTYNGDPGGNRFTTLAQIDQTTLGRLAPRWIHSVPDAGRLQVTPVVVGGIMYVTAPNQCFALDAGSGREIWHYKQPLTKGIAGGNANRGVAVDGDRVFMATDHAHLIALDRFTGARLWDTEMADWRLNYAASSAPLVARGLVVSGVSGGEHGANGFVAAYDEATGKEAWRFWCVPRRGEAGFDTWQGKDIEHGGAPTWFTGSYDTVRDVVYWPTGNPGKEYNGEDRKGDNLYANSILALEGRTGRRLWHYQFTPHDLWDWDATQTSILADLEWQGETRPLLLHADRNGFFYVFDRRDGALLLARPFVKNLTWASGIGADGRPVKLPGQEPTTSGTKVCPSQDGATNWYAPSFDPARGLLYVQTFEKCSVYTKSDQAEWESGRTYLGGTQKTAAEPRPERILRAIDVRTGSVAWEMPQPGAAISWGGTLATATGLVFVAAEGGTLMAVDGATGKPRWTFETSEVWRASPMTYMFDGRQYVAVAAGPNIIALALRD